VREEVASAGVELTVSVSTLGRVVLRGLHTEQLAEVGSELGEAGFAAIARWMKRA
jgi:hypothetical protein